MIETLISDLLSRDPLVRVRAAPALGDLGAAAIKAIPALLSLTQDETQHPLIRVLAAAAVAKIDPAQTGAVIPVLISALNSDDAPLQGAAADEQAVLGKHAEPALPALFALLGDNCAAVRSTAAQAICRITGNRMPAEQVGRSLLRSEDWLDRQVGGGLLVLLGANRQLIAHLLPTADRSLFVASDRQMTASISGQGLRTRFLRDLGQYS